MKVQAEVSLYPLRTRDIGDPIARFIECLRRPGLDLEVRPMSSSLSGEPNEVFDTLRDAFVRLAEEHHVVLTVKASNACPENVTPEQDQKRFSRTGKYAHGSDADPVNPMKRK